MVQTIMMTQPIHLYMSTQDYFSRK